MDDPVILVLGKYWRTMSAPRRVVVVKLISSTCDGRCEIVITIVITSCTCSNAYALLTSTLCINLALMQVWDASLSRLLFNYGR